MKENDLLLWQTWKKDPSPTNLQALLNALRPLIRYESSRYTQTGINPTLLEAKAQEMAFEAIKTYDPKYSQLSTHVVNHLKRLNRYAIENQNALRVQENKVFEYRKYVKAESELKEKLGRDPTELELQSKLGPSFRLKNVLKPKAEHMYSMNLEGGGGAPPRGDLSYENVSMQLTHNSLKGTQKEVMGLAYGIGKRPMKASAIAAKLGISKPAVSKHLRAIEKKYNRYNGATNFMIG